jgi:hypothetical protein
VDINHCHCTFSPQTLFALHALAVSPPHSYGPRTMEGLPVDAAVSSVGSQALPSEPSTPVLLLEDDLFDFGVSGGASPLPRVPPHALGFPGYRPWSPLPPIPSGDVFDFEMVGEQCSLPPSDEGPVDPSVQVQLLRFFELNLDYFSETWCTTGSQILPGITIVGMNEDNVVVGVTHDEWSQHTDQRVFKTASDSLGVFFHVPVCFKFWTQEETLDYYIRLYGSTVDRQTLLDSPEQYAIALPAWTSAAKAAYLEKLEMTGQLIPGVFIEDVSEERVLLHMAYLPADLHDLRVEYLKRSKLGLFFGCPVRGILLTPEETVELYQCYYPGDMTGSSLSPAVDAAASPHSLSGDCDEPMLDDVSGLMTPRTDSLWCHEQM